MTQPKVSDIIDRETAFQIRMAFAERKRMLLAAWIESYEAFRDDREQAQHIMTSWSERIQACNDALISMGIENY